MRQVNVEDASLNCKNVKALTEMKNIMETEIRKTEVKRNNNSHIFIMKGFKKVLISPIRFENIPNRPKSEVPLRVILW